MHTTAQFLPKRRGLFWGVVGVVAIAAVAYGAHRYAIQNPNRNHAMTELTENMRTACFGRYLLGIPTDAEFAIGPAEVNSASIVSDESPSRSDTAFTEKVKQREAELRTIKHDTRGTSLLEAINVDGGGQRLFVYFPDQETTRLLNCEIHVRDNSYEWSVVYKKTIQKHLTESKNLVSLLAGRIKAREKEAIPNEPGLCIRNGIVTGAPDPSNDYREGMTGGIRLEEYRLSFSITSETSGRREPGQTLLDRVDKSYRMLDAAGGQAATIKTLRRGENVVIDGRKGQEIVTTFVDKDFDVLDAKAEVYGDVTPRAPTFKVQMEVGRPRGPNAGGNPKSLSDDEALALWDAILKSIRPRPGAF